MLKLYFILNYFFIKTYCVRLSSTTLINKFDQIFIPENNVEVYQQTMIDFVTKVLCNANKTYSNFYIYVDKTVSLPLSNKVIGGINNCIAGCVFVSK